MAALLLFIELLVLLTLTNCDALKDTEPTLNFVMMGDWGGKPSSPYFTNAEKKIASSMGKMAEEIGSQFTVALGDNFYDKGVTDVNDMRFEKTFENVYTAPSLQSRWYVVCGNHDHYGNASAEVAYTEKSKRWYMPDFYYTEVLKPAGTNFTVQLVMIDTVILAGLTHPTLRYMPPSGPKYPNMADDEWVWLEATLNASKADWLIVGGHYPVWSVAEHGPTRELVDHLRPLLMKYNVTAYFCGHDHDLQHIKEDDSSVNYFVTGAGHLTDSSTAHEDAIPKGSLKYRYGKMDPLTSHGGFNTVSITADTMTVTFYDAEGKHLYTSQMSKTRWA